jgi:hypothetical protein
MSDRHRSKTTFFLWGGNDTFMADAAGSMAHQSGVVVLTNSANGQSIMPDVVTALCAPSRGRSVPI